MNDFNRNEEQEGVLLAMRIANSIIEHFEPPRQESNLGTAAPIEESNAIFSANDIIALAQPQNMITEDSDEIQRRLELERPDPMISSTEGNDEEYVSNVEVVKVGSKLKAVLLHKKKPIVIGIYDTEIEAVAAKNIVLRGINGKFDLTRDEVNAIIKILDLSEEGWTGRGCLAIYRFSTKIPSLRSLLTNPTTPTHQAFRARI